MKVVDLGKHPGALDAVRKEICLHRRLKHDNIIKFYGKIQYEILLLNFNQFSIEGGRKEDSMQYMFLEYAVGGELFDRIEPDVGMEESLARRYFRQLINGLVS